MHMHVHQARRHDHTGGVNNLCLRVIYAISDHGYPSVFDQNIHNAADSAHRIYESSVLYQ